MFTLFVFVRSAPRNRWNKLTLLFRVPVVLGGYFLNYLLTI